MLTSYEICQRAADHIEAHGWHKGSFLAIPKGGEHIPGTVYPACAVGACKYASGYYTALYLTPSVNWLDVQKQNGAAWAAARTAWLASPESESGAFGSIHEYNDAPTTTKEDILRILRNCPKD